MKNVSKRFPIGSLITTALFASAAFALPISAQERGDVVRDTVLDPRALPREIAHQVIDLFNAPGTLRSSGRLDIATGREVRGDVAVLNGPLTIGGRVTGRVIAINTDVTFLPGARLDSDLTVVGGQVHGANDASVEGEIRIYRQPLRYRERGDRIVIDRTDDDDEERWWRHVRRDRRAYSTLRLTSAHTYNRVEGFPIYFGPRIRRDLPGGGRFSVDAFGIFRTSDHMDWETENLGHTVWGEIRSGGREGLAVGGRLFDMVTPVEPWQLSELEVGLGAFVMTRDYRDYFGRHGGEAFVRLFSGRRLTLEGAFSDERWSDRRDGDPFTLFRSSNPWRPNPLMDEGKLHIATARLRYDTRNYRDDPRSGWHIAVDYERGSGQFDRLAPTSVETRPVSAPSLKFDRAFADVRRYNRVAPDAQLNMRVVAGGWMNGDDLPMQRRFSLSGPGALAGYAFRALPPGEDVLHCSGGAVVPGVPGQCERMVLAQLEYRGDLDVSFDFDGWNEGRGGRGDAFLGSWVVFLDSGRGWLVGAPAGTMVYAKDELPPLSTWRTDVGVGMDFNPVGIYLAKAVSGGAKLPPNFFIRLTKRF